MVVYRRPRFEPDLALVVLQCVSDAPALSVAIWAHIVSAAKVGSLIGPVLVVVACDPRLIPGYIIATVDARLSVDYCRCVRTQTAQRRWWRWW
jgi:hypothetical protein